MSFAVDTDGFALIEGAVSASELDALAGMLAALDGCYGRRNLLREGVTCLMRRLRRLGHAQNPSPQDPTQFSDRL